MALGAFVAGLLLAETEYRKVIETTIDPFKGLLLGLFFFTVGMNIDVRELAREPFWLLATVAGLIALKSSILFALGRLYKLSRAASLEMALLLGPGGEFAFVGIGLAATVGIMPKPVASFTLAVTSLTMALIPLLSIAAGRLVEKMEPPRAVDRSLKVGPAPQTKHAIVVGHGRVGKVVCSLLSEHGVAFTAVDSDAYSVTSYFVPGGTQGLLWRRNQSRVSESLRVDGRGGRHHHHSHAILD